MRPFHTPSHDSVILGAAHASPEPHTSSLAMLGDGIIRALPVGDDRVSSRSAPQAPISRSPLSCLTLPPQPARHFERSRDSEA